MTQDEYPYKHFKAETYYPAPDTSDKWVIETWSEYWDRKRRERHGKDCGCPLCSCDYVIGELIDMEQYPNDMG